MFFDKYVQRLRAAHALCFAMDAGIRPRASELRALGLEKWSAPTVKVRAGR